MTNLFKYLFIIFFFLNFNPDTQAEEININQELSILQSINSSNLNHISQLNNLDSKVHKLLKIESIRTRYIGYLRLIQSSNTPTTLPMSRFSSPGMESMSRLFSPISTLFQRSPTRTPLPAIHQPAGRDSTPLPIFTQSNSPVESNPVDFTSANFSTESRNQIVLALFSLSQHLKFDVNPEELKELLLCIESARSDLIDTEKGYLGTIFQIMENPSGRINYIPFSKTHERYCSNMHQISQGQNDPLFDANPLQISIDHDGEIYLNFGRLLGKGMSKAVYSVISTKSWNEIAGGFYYPNHYPTFRERYAHNPLFRNTVLDYKPIQDRIQEEAFFKQLNNNPGIVETHNFGKFALYLKKYPLSLDHLIYKQVGNKFTFRERIKIILEAGKSLRHLHNAGFVHGDVKPGNILFNILKDGRYQVVFTDLGTSYIASKEVRNRPGPKRIGTLYFLAPDIFNYCDSPNWVGEDDLEKAENAKKSDVFSLSVIASMLWSREAIDKSPISWPTYTGPINQFMSIRDSQLQDLQRFPFEENPDLNSQFYNGLRPFLNPNVLERASIQPFIEFFESFEKLLEDPA